MSRSAGKKDVTTYFSGLASLYADYRPTYPIEAIDWMLEGLPRPIRTADVGCGTGISTRLLAARGVNVIGLDPNRDMLEEARQRDAADPLIEYRLGNGEATGLNDRSIDLVVCAQSFHWFEGETALREFHRILKRRGRLALLWNVRDERDPFTAIYSDIARRSQVDAAQRGLMTSEARAGDPTVGGWFGNVRQKSFVNRQALTLDGLLGRARSASYFPKGGALKAQFEGELRDAFDRFQREGVVELMHQSQVTVAERNDDKGGEDAAR